MMSGSLAALCSAAERAGLAVISAGEWPGSGDGDEVPALAGFIESSFSPLIAEAARRALSARDGAGPPDAGPPDAGPAAAGPSGPETVTAIVIVTALGDLTSAVRVAEAVDGGRRISPLLFFQSVPNAVAGYLAARWRLTGPVACVTGTDAGLDVAALTIGDGDADEVLVVRADLATTAGEDRDRAAAVLVTGASGGDQTRSGRSRC